MVQLIYNLLGGILMTSSIITKKSAINEQAKYYNTAITCAQAFLCRVQSEVQNLIVDFDENDFDVTLKLFEKQIPTILLDDNIKKVLDIRRGLTRIRMAKDPVAADERLEEFYYSAEKALKLLEVIPMISEN